MADFMNVSENPDEPTNKQTDSNELLVFGYQCKLYRDDQKAKYIDGGKHLIPWMDDPSLFIDRYDGRGHLFNLRPYDSDFTPRNRSLSDEEARIEALCDEERYLELHTDIAEKRLYEEEELKRLNEALNEGYSAVGFSYNACEQQADYNPEQPTGEQTEDDSDGEIPFYPPPELRIPCDMVVPDTEKQNALVEKTAEFISKQSTQMEIVIKTRQQHNPKFDFLQQSHSLYAYYQHLVKAIKSGRYKPSQKPRPVMTVAPAPADVQLPDVPEMSTGEMLAIVKQSLPDPQIQNTSYAKLVNKISRHTTGRNSPNVNNSLQAELPPGLAPVKLPGASGRVDKVYYPPHTHDNSITPSLVSYTSSTPQDVVIGPRLPVISPVSPPNVPPDDPPLQHGCQPPPPGTREEDSMHQLGFLVPGAKQQLVVDRMAKYVVKNGNDFETVVKEKRESRFDFVLPVHKYNDYYEYKKACYEMELCLGLIEVRHDFRHMVSHVKKNVDKSQNQMNNSNRAVCFSIKAKEAEQSNVEINKQTLSVLYESSSGEDDEIESDLLRAGIIGTSVLHQSQSAPQLSALTQPKSNGTSPKAIPHKKSAEARLADRLATAAKDKLGQVNREKQLANQEIQQANREKQLANQEQEQADREKHIQAERKRKAAMFLSMLKDTSVPEQATTASVTVNKEDNHHSTIEAVAEHSSGSDSDIPLGPGLYIESGVTRSPTYSRFSPAPSRLSPAPSRHSPTSSRYSPAPSRHSPAPSRHSPASSRHSPSPTRHSKSSPHRRSISRHSRTPPRNSPSRHSSRSSRLRSATPERKRHKRRHKSRSTSPRKHKKHSRSPKRHRSRSRSPHHHRHKKSSRSPSSRHKRHHKKKSHKRRARSRSNSPSKRSRARSPSKSPETSTSSRGDRHKKKQKEKPSSNIYVAPHPSEVIDISADEDDTVMIDISPEHKSSHQTTPKPSGESTPRPVVAKTMANSKAAKEISQDLLLKVRAMLKASQEPVT